MSQRFDPEHHTAAVYDRNGQRMPSVIAYWFAWYAFHPKTEVFQPADAPPGSSN